MAVVSADNALAEIFKCQDGNGVITLQSLPCADNYTTLTDLPKRPPLEFKPAQVQQMEDMRFAPEQRLDQLATALDKEGTGGQSATASLSGTDNESVVQQHAEKPSATYKSHKSVSRKKAHAVRERHAHQKSQKQQKP